MDGKRPKSCSLLLSVDAAIFASLPRATAGDGSTTSVTKHLKVGKECPRIWHITNKSTRRLITEKLPIVPWSVVSLVPTHPPIKPLKCGRYDNERVLAGTDLK